MARLAPIEYKLDEHKLPGNRFLTGTLDIELDCVDGSPYIWCMDIRSYDIDTELTTEHYYRHGRTDNADDAIKLKDELHRDKKLMDYIWDECAAEGGWNG